MSRQGIGIVAACTIGNFVSVTPALHAVFGLFLIPIAAEFSWPRAQVSGVLGVVAIVTAACYPLLGRLADRIGARRPILFGNLLLGLALALLTSANGGVTQYYLLFVLIGVAGAIPSSMMFTKILTGWFDASRGAMLGIAGGLGNGAGATVMPIVAGILIAHVGWRGAFLGIALLVILIGFPVMYLLLKDPPGAIPQQSSAGEARAAAASANEVALGAAIRTGTFWMLLIAIALGAGCLTAVFAHVVPVLTDRGVSLSLATGVVSVFALVCAAWQIAMGWLLDRRRSPRIAAPFYVIPVAGLLLVQSADTPAALLAAGGLMGVGLGTEFGALPYFISRYFGTKAYGAISGVMYSIVMLAQGFTPFLMDRIYDMDGSYDRAIQAIIVALIAGAALITLLPAFKEVQAPVAGLEVVTSD